MLTSGSLTPPLCSIGISSATHTRAYDVPTFQRLLISALHSSSLRHLYPSNITHSRAFTSKTTSLSLRQAWVANRI
ncbi:hypothetical protein BT96DRAFT_392233 [Gymnopus androsaceus JB14]|uniref:Uncharacterized protein n=1 Tax=Gymnopus androsaceus JB14 TaxID=1447944 RepID=A0A6A4GV74_9AGAR|nr:hypothetical protein BT96DRAFT_392233 [Gymnopus androsaceus JB14]